MGTQAKRLLDDKTFPWMLGQSGSVALFGKVKRHKREAAPESELDRRSRTEICRCERVRWRLKSLYAPVLSAVHNKQEVMSPQNTRNSLLLDELQEAAEHLPRVVLHSNPPFWPWTSCFPLRDLTNEPACKLIQHKPSQQLTAANWPLVFFSDLQIQSAVAATLHNDSYLQLSSHWDFNETRRTLK